MAHRSGNNNNKSSKQEEKKNNPTVQQFSHVLWDCLFWVSLKKAVSFGQSARRWLANRALLNGQPRRHRGTKNDDYLLLLAHSSAKLNNWHHHHYRHHKLHHKQQHHRLSFSLLSTISVVLLFVRSWVANEKKWHHSNEERVPCAFNKKSERRFNCF